MKKLLVPFFFEENQSHKHRFTIKAPTSNQAEGTTS